MNQPAKAQEPSMEEILASIRRIIADDETKPPKPEPAPRPAAIAPAPPPSPAAEPAAMSQDDIDAMLSSFDEPAPTPRPPEPEPEPEPEVLELTEEMAAPEPEPPAFRTIGEPDVMFAEPPPPEPEPEPPPPPPRRAQQVARAAPPPPEPPQPDEPPLMSARTGAAVDAAFNTLAQTVLIQNAKTLEDLVKEMLRPMLKAWLDDNLPNMVERLVRAEIERVSRGR
jgi:uncharacterized protein